MRRIPRAVVLGLIVLTPSVALHGMPQEAASVATPAKVVLSPEEMENFLLNAKIVATKGVSKGVTNTRRATLSDGRVTHDAQIQSIDQATMLFNAPGAVEVNFKDTYRYNIGGYRLARLIGLDNVPMSVERRVDGKPSAVTWWIDDVLMDEGARLKKHVRFPDAQMGAMQTHIMRVFDELIQNKDRNMGNLLWTTDWKMWMIDHTRAFRLGKELLKPRLLERIERSLYTNLRDLTFRSLTAAADRSLTKEEVEAVLARRDIILKLFDERIAARGEASVLYTIPRP